jgi:hypothetical protein
MFGLTTALLGGIAKALGLDDGRSHKKSAIAKTPLDAATQNSGWLPKT